jgi:hypothetical protein
MWRVLHHWVEQARERADYADVKRVAIDETAARRGHDYVSLFVDMDQRRVLFVTEGRGADTVEAFADDLEAHNGDASRIKQVCIDMSGAFIKGVTAVERSHNPAPFGRSEIKRILATLCRHRFVAEELSPSRRADVPSQSEKAELVAPPLHKTRQVLVGAVLSRCRMGVSSYLPTLLRIGSLPPY